MSGKIAEVYALTGHKKMHDLGLTHKFDKTCELLVCRIALYFIPSIEDLCYVSETKASFLTRDYLEIVLVRKLSMSP